MKTCSRRQFVHLGIASLFTSVSTGCGTILYPERKGQPAGPLNWPVVALDALGLCLFFVPGVIAFAVDFNNGTIYLPPEEYGHTKGWGKNRTLKPVSVPAGKMSREEIETVVSDKTGRPIKLENGTYQTKSLANIDDFWVEADQMELN